MIYEGTVYRPPSEGRSLIVQVTIGCAHNTCTFCNMYKDKHFRIRKMDEILADFQDAYDAYGPYIRRIFLADGDALIIKTANLLRILEEIHRLFPHAERVASYGTAQDILHKSEDELRQLQQAGLGIVYLGAETGDDEILKATHKGVTRAEIIQAGQKLKRCGLQSSITLISGLGGCAKVKEHAISCAELITATNPDYASFLTLSLYPGTEMYDDMVQGKFKPITTEDVVEEVRLFLEHVDSPQTVFRMNHASNSVVLAGTLNKDIPDMLKKLEDIKEHRHYRTVYNTGIL